MAEGERRGLCLAVGSFGTTGADDVEPDLDGWSPLPFAAERAAEVRAAGAILTGAFTVVDLREVSGHAIARRQT